MTLTEAIKHCEDVADYDCFTDEQRKCSDEHRQLADWLRELKERREKAQLSGEDATFDCISRQAAIDALHMHLMYRMGTDSNKKRLDDWINGVPSVEPERKKGKWIEQDAGGDGVFYECSVCQDAFTLIDGTPSDNNYNFCPNCGADMGGEEE